MDMLSLTDYRLRELAARSYSNAYVCHGDLGLDAETFLARLLAIIEKHLGMNPFPLSAIEFVEKLHATDLYLAIACGRANELAWDRFALSYCAYIRRVSEYVSYSKGTARDLADGVLGHIFLPDSTGRSRMASYEGLSPLTTWLAVIIKRSAINEGVRRCNNMESLDAVIAQTDESGIQQAEAAIRASRYGQPLRDSWQRAIGLLSERERAIVCLRYEQNLQVSQIAELYGVKPQAITQQIDRSRRKLRERIRSILATKHGLGPAAIDECVAYLLSSPELAALSVK